MYISSNITFLIFSAIDIWFERISSFNPNKDLIYSAPLDSLYSAIQYEKHHGFFQNKEDDVDHDIRNTAINFLRRVEPIILERIKKKEKLSKEFEEKIKKEMSKVKKWNT